MKDGDKYFRIVAIMVAVILAILTISTVPSNWIGYIIGLVGISIWILLILQLKKKIEQDE